MPVTFIRATIWRLRRAMHGSTALVVNSGAMAVGAMATAVLGLLYWWLAARSFPPAAIGKASALLSVMGLIGLLGEAGLGTLLVGEIARHRQKAPGLIAAAAALASGLGILLGLVFTLATSFTGFAGPGGGLEACLFVAGCALTALHSVALQALVGNLNGGARMVGQVLFSLAKLLLIVTVVALGGRSDTDIVLTWPVGILACWFCFDIVTGGGARRLVGRPDFGLLHQLRHKVVGHYALDVAVQTPGVVMPYLVLVLLSPDTNAAFAAVWMLVSTASMIPALAATALFPVVRADPTRYRRDLAVSLTMSLLFSLVCAVGIMAYSRQMLAFFNPAYPAIAGTDLRFIGLGLFGLSLKFHVCALARLGDWMHSASRWFAIGAALELASTVVGARINGLEGLVLGWTSIVTLEGVASLVLLTSISRLQLGIACLAQAAPLASSGSKRYDL